MAARGPLSWRRVDAWQAFFVGVVCGGAIAGGFVALWMRTKLAEVRVGKESAEASAGEMGARFQAAADAALRSSQSAFLEASRSTLDAVRAQMTGELVERQTQIAGVVKPLGETLEKLDAQVRRIEVERGQTMAGLDGQLRQLMAETGTLRNALQSPQARGRWGEITLRRVAELSGMAANCDFFEQETFDSGAGRLRPDMIVRLPGGRSLAVDAKAPLAGYIEAMETAEPAAKRAALERHAQQVGAHVAKLGAKQYWSQLQPAPELVVLFLPGDHFFSAALEFRPGLIEEALDQKVVIATPVTLISLLRGISYGWQQDQLAKNAEEIRKVASEFSQRLESVHGYYADAGKQLGKAVEAYNRSVGSWQERLLPALRRVQELGIGGNGEGAEMQRVEATPREPRKVDAG